MMRFIRRHKGLIKSLLFPLSVGGLSSLLTQNDMDVYKTIVQPSFAPPGWIFPVVWSILYLLMGYSYWRTRLAPVQLRQRATALYLVQLALNFLWPLLFFKGQLWGLALLVLVLLWAAVALMIGAFYRCERKAAALQIPYLLWLSFAAYLNWVIALLN